MRCFPSSPRSAILGAIHLLAHVNKYNTLAEGEGVVEEAHKQEEKGNENRVGRNAKEKGAGLSSRGGYTS